MLKSMTAFGRSHRDTAMGSISIEMQSVNRKHLDLQIAYYPPFLSRFDSSIKKLIGSYLHRGQVNVKISVVFQRESGQKVVPNLSLAKQVKVAWEQIAAELSMPLDSKAILQTLAATPEILMYEESISDEEGIHNELMVTLTETLVAFTAMREQEGRHLQQDILARLITLKIGMDQIAELAVGGTQKHYEKLKNRLDELLSGSIENEERILREIALYAEKIDVSEEITRFNSHLSQFHTLIIDSTQPAGKAIDFLLQELLRETNTIGSKTVDIRITRLILEIKNELERIREQVQNVE